MIRLTAGGEFRPALRTKLTIALDAESVKHMNRPG